MGRVIKGSAESEERYSVAPPPLVSAASYTDGADLWSDEFDGGGVAVAGDESAAQSYEPAIDFDAIAAQAQEVIDTAARSAETIVTEAEERARGIAGDAERHAAELAQAARRDGRDAGYTDGLAAAQTEMADMLESLRELITAVRDERHVLLASAEPELVRLAVGIAERVLHQQIALDGGVVVEMAKAAIARIVDRDKITVRVNPADIERMRGHRDELLALGDVRTMRVIEDQRVDRGGVILETDAGSIDAKISTQLNEVRNILHIVDDVVVVTPAAEPAAAARDGEPFPATRAS